MIKEIERTGYPAGYEERRYYGIDALGNDVYEGDEIFVYEDDIYLIDDLSYREEEILENCGAERRIV